MTDDSITDMVTELSSLKQKVESVLPYVRDDVERIIARSEQNPTVIENVLDTLLDFAPLGIGVAEFNRLNQYYMTVNRENALLYETYLKKGSAD